MCIWLQNPAFADLYRAQMSVCVRGCRETACVRAWMQRETACVRGCLCACLEVCVCGCLRAWMSACMDVHVCVYRETAVAAYCGDKYLGFLLEDAIQG